MTGIVFGVKGTLDGERTDMTGGGEYRFAAAMLKMKVQRSLPAFLFSGNTVLCNVVTPLQNQDKTAAMSIDRRESISII